MRSRMSGKSTDVTSNCKSQCNHCNNNSKSNGNTNSNSSSVFFQSSARRKRKVLKKTGRTIYYVAILWILFFCIYVFVFIHDENQNQKSPIGKKEDPQLFDELVQNAKKIDLQKQKMMREQLTMTQGKEKSKLKEFRNDEQPSTSDLPRINSSSNNLKLRHPRPLPQWIINYIHWHNEMRAKFPGQRILTDPNAPKLLIRICLGLCGGLHDWLGQLPLDLYMANQTKRVLLIKWQKPQPLQEFLVPPRVDEGGIDWTFPDFFPGWGTLGYNCNRLNICTREVCVQPKIDGTMQNKDDFQTDEKFASLIDNNIHILNEGALKDTKHVTFTIMGHLSENILEERLRNLGEVDMIHNTPTFGHIFHSFFKPHPNVQNQIDSVSKELGLVKGE